MKQFLLLGMAMLIGMTSHHVQGQMIIDTWSFTTGVDTTLWMDLGADYTVLFSTTNGTQNYAGSGLRDIGFPFTLGATTHTKFSTNVNGTVRLGTALLPAVGYINEPLGQNINAGPRIDALGRAGMIDTSCYMRSAVLGDSGSRVLVVEARLREYADMGSAEGHYVHFQVQLFEAGGLRIVYGQVDPGAIYGSSQNGVAATGNSSNKDVVFFDFASQRAVRFNGNCTLRNAAEVFPTKGRWYMIAPDPEVCPWPSTVTIPTNPDGGGVLLTRIAGDSNTMRVMIHAMDIDTVWEGTESTMVLPPVNPTTTYTLSLQTLCGSDTSYRTRDIDFFSGCGAVVRLPWETAFTTLSYSDCWDMPYVSGNNADFTRRWRQTSTTAYVYCPGAAGTYNSWLISPVVYLPDGDGLTLQWDYRALLSSSGVAPHVELRVAPCAEDGTTADGAWSTLMVLDGEYQSYTALAANLDAWRGQRVRVAWVRTGEGGGSAYVDNVSLYRQQEPRLLWEVPSVAFAGDTTLYTARMFAGVDSNVVFTWHSSLLDSTIVTTDSMVSEVYVVYPAAGIDTVTVVLSNAYGSDTATAVVEVADCRAVTALPWSNDFAGSYACWTINGWQRASSTSAYNENGDLISHDNVMYASSTGKYMLTQPVTIPATGVEHLSLWAEAGGPLMVRVSPTASTDTASYTDTLLTLPNSSRLEIFWRTAGLAAYAGQTVRFGFFKTAGTRAFVRRVKVDYDTLPALGNIVVPAISRTDSTIACSVELLRGVGEGLTYTWHSSLMDTTWVDTGANGSHGFNVTYTIGGTDTITVVAANAYGSDTMVRTVQVMDCRPVTALPWREDFDDDLLCWYQTYNSTNNRWQRSHRYSASYYIKDYYAFSSCNISESLTTPVDAWLVSRAITIPADTALAVRLFWHVGISSGNNLTNNYRVMVSTAADCTDTTAYEELYHDTLPLPNQNIMVQRSVSLTPYAGQTIFIAFRNQPLVRRVTALIIDKVEVRETANPRLLLAADNETVYHGDTATFTATLQEGSDSNLVYTWHSSLLDSTWVDTAVGGQWRLTYGMTGGMDTVTLVATNAYGSDTAMVCISSVIDSLPSISHIAHGAAFVGDTTEYTVVDNRSVVTGQTYTWHSTLLDTTIVLQSTQAAFRLVYNAEGYDTVTVVKSNVFGSSTSSAVVAVGSHPLPEVALTIPARVEVDVAAEFAASINDCSANGRAFTWHSTLLDTTVATLLPTLALMYEAEGTDTLTVIASNAYGADTAVTVFEVVDCSARAVPYTEDFEGVTATLSSEQGNLADCWDYSWNGSNAAYGPHVITTGGYQYISNIPDNALFLVAGNEPGYGNTAEVSLPRMADSLQNLSLAFDYRFESSSYGTLTVGYYNANNVFTTVKTMPAHNGSYRRDTVSFAAATVPDAAMVLRWYHGSSWYAVVIDNIEVFRDTAPHAPATVTVDSIGITHARVNWTAGVNATAYRVVVDGVVDTTVSGLSVVLQGLAARTQYTVRVASLAGNDTSSYATAQFLTRCGEVDLPYANNFSNGDASIDCWTHLNINNYVQNEYLVITRGTFIYPSLMSTPVINHPGNDMVVSFRLKKFGTSSDNNGILVVGAMTDPADSTTFVAIDTLTATGSWTACRISTRGLDTAHVAIAFRPGIGTNGYSGVCIDNLGIDIPVPCAQLLSAEATSLGPTSAMLSWQYDNYGALTPNGVLIDLIDLTSDDTTTFVAHGTDTTLVSPFLYHSYHAELRVLCGSDTSEAVSLDWEPLPCTAPQATASADTHSIALTWQRLGSENLWVVEYRAVGSTAWNTAGSTDSTTFTIAGLTQATHYEMRVGSLCLEGDTLYGNTLTVATLCGRFGLPYCHDFSTGQVGCWFVPSGVVSSANSYSDGGARMDDYMAQPRPITSPEFDRDLNGLIVRYTVNSNRFFSPMIKVGVSDANGQNALWLDSTIAADGTHEYSYSFENFTGTQRHIIFYGDFITSLIRVQVDAIGSCQPVNDLLLTHLSDTAATLQWSPSVWPGQWAVYLDGALQGTTNDTSFLLDGLQPQTNYVASVSQVCSIGDTAVSCSLRFSTPCQPFTLPYSMDFENEYRLDSICWRTILYPYSSYPSADIYGTSSRNLFFVVVNSGDNTESCDPNYRNFACSPLIDPQGHGVDISFHASLWSFDATSFFEVGVMADVADTAGFIPLGNVAPSSSNSTYINHQFTVAAAALPQPFSLAFRFGGTLVRCYIDDISITASIPVTHELSLSVNDTTMGSATGAGTYVEGTNVTIAATPNEGYHFVMWNDSVTAPVRTIKVETDTLFTAFFAPDQHTVTVASSDEGACRTYGSGTYDHGDTIEIGYVALDTASAGGHWVILGWNDGNADNPRQVVVTSDTTFTILCQWVGDSVGINDAPEVNNRRVNIYPNPATTTVRVECEGWNAETATLLDLNGRVVSTQTIQQSNSQAIILDISMLPRGTYFLRLTDGTTTAIHKLILQ